MAPQRALANGGPERHLETLALLDSVTGVLGLGAAFLLWRAARHAVDQDEALVRFAAGLACLGTAACGTGLAWGLRRRVPVARTIHLIAAVLALPLVPVGTAWGAYAFRVLASARGRSFFEEEPHRVRPFYGAVMPIVAGAVAVMTFSMLKADQLALTHRVHRARVFEATQRAAVGRSIQHLRELSGDDRHLPDEP